MQRTRWVFLVNPLGTLESLDKGMAQGWALLFVAVELRMYIYITLLCVELPLPCLETLTVRHHCVDTVLVIQGCLVSTSAVAGLVVDALVYLHVW